MFLGVFYLLSSCKKDKGQDSQYDIDPDIRKYVITLSNSQIASYSLYINDSLNWTSTYHDDDSIVELRKENSNHTLIEKTRFRIGIDGLAETSIDTFFSNMTVAYINRQSYQFLNGFLVGSTSHYQQFGTSTDSGTVFLTYTFVNNNMTLLQRVVTNSGWLCSDGYSYNTQINKLDIAGFNNGILGNISKNLTNHISWNIGCPNGPSSTGAYSDYTYILNNNGFVTKRIEIYTPSYSTHYAPPKSTLRTVVYEYLGK